MRRKVTEICSRVPIARVLFGNEFPVQKYVGAMVRKSTRVVLVIENDFDEVEGDPATEEPYVTKRIVCKKKFTFTV